MDALRASPLASSTDLFVYSDAARNDEEAESVSAVRAIFVGLKGFKSVTVIERESNFGLSRNITEGVTEVCGLRGRVIVLEDDIVVSRSFLTFMNLALDKFEEDARVWHISGWNYAMSVEGLPDAYFWRVMNCWGWATWTDRWANFRKDPAGMLSSWSKEDVWRFNVEGSLDFWSQVEENASGRRNTWAVFWYASIFRSGGLCLTVGKSLTANIGLDGTGENCGLLDATSTQLSDKIPSLDTPVEESKAAIARLRASLGWSSRFVVPGLGAIWKLLKVRMRR